MNKQEVINQIKKFSELDPNYPCAINRTPNVIHAIEQLDEPQKVKVPAFVAEWFEENKHNLNFAIYELCEAGKVPVDLYEGLTDFERWFYLNHDIDTLIRMQDGYEIEEEPKWIVRVKEMFFMNWGEDGTCPTFVIDDDPGAKRLAKPFIKSEAQSLAESLHGSIEKV